MERLTFCHGPVANPASLGSKPIPDDRCVRRLSHLRSTPSYPIPSPLPTGERGGKSWGGLRCIDRRRFATPRSPACDARPAATPPAPRSTPSPRRSCLRTTPMHRAGRGYSRASPRRAGAGQAGRFPPSPNPRRARPVRQARQRRRSVHLAGGRLPPLESRRLRRPAPRGSSEASAAALASFDSCWIAPVVAAAAP